MKHNELLAERTTNDQISQLFIKCKHGKDIHEHKKQ